MAKGMPSMVALLGLLAVAGFQNRDKISEVLGSMKNASPGPGGGQPTGIDGLFSGLGDLLGGKDKDGNVLTSGLGELLNSFKGAGQTEVADSWVNPGVPTQGLTTSQVEAAIGDDNLTELASRTGLSRDELLNRLATAIPATVDQLTPGGHMPTEEQARQRLLPAT